MCDALVLSIWRGVLRGRGRGCDSARLIPCPWVQPVTIYQSPPRLQHGWHDQKSQLGGLLEAPVSMVARRMCPLMSNLAAIVPFFIHNGVTSDRFQQ